MSGPIGAMPRGSIALDVLFECGARVEVEHVDGRWTAVSGDITTHGDTRQEAIERCVWKLRAARPAWPTFSRSGT